MNVCYPVIARRKQTIENIVLIRRDFKARDRNAHLLQHPTSHHISEVSRRNDKFHIPALRCRDTEPREQIIDALRQNPREIDGIDRRQTMLKTERLISENL